MVESDLQQVAFMYSLHAVVFRGDADCPTIYQGHEYFIDASIEHIGTKLQDS